MRRKQFVLSVAIQSFCFMLNVALGTFNLVRGHRMGYMSFLFAGFILGLTILNLRARRNAMRIFRDVQRLQFEAHLLLFQTWDDPMIKHKATENFLKVVKALGKHVEEYSETNGYIVLKEGAASYRIQYGQVVKFVHSGIPYEATCTQYQGGAPPLEQIAAVALLLHHNPRLFDQWAHNRGYWYA